MARPPVVSRFSAVSLDRGDADRPGLVGAVELEHLAAGLLLELGRPLARDPLPAGEEHPQRGQVGGGERRRVQHHHELARHRGQHGHLVLLDRAAGCRPGRTRRAAPWCSRTSPAPRGRSTGRSRTAPAARCTRPRAPRSRPRSCASGPKYLRMFIVCITHFGRPVVPEVELRKKRSSAPRARAARRGRAAWPASGTSTSAPPSVRVTTPSARSRVRCWSSARSRTSSAAGAPRCSRSGHQARAAGRARAAGSPRPRPARGPIPRTTTPAFWAAR